MNNSAPQSELFRRDDLDGIQPTGSPWAICKEDPATLPVPDFEIKINIESGATEKHLPQTEGHCILQIDYSREYEA